MCVGFLDLDAMWHGALVVEAGAVDFRDGRLGVYDELGDCGYRYRFETRWLPAILQGHVAWEDFFLSLRFTAWREPGHIQRPFARIVSSACREALDAVENYEVALPSPRPDNQSRPTVPAIRSSATVRTLVPTSVTPVKFSPVAFFGA